MGTILLGNVNSQLPLLSALVVPMIFPVISFSVIWPAEVVIPVNLISF